MISTYTCMLCCFGQLILIFSVLFSEFNPRLHSHILMYRIQLRPITRWVDLLSTEFIVLSWKLLKCMYFYDLLFYSCIWLHRKNFFFSIVSTYGFHPPDIQKVDNAHHHWINLYPLDSAVGFLNTYLSDSDVQTEDNVIQRINLCPVDNTLISLILTLWIVFYPMDNAIQCLNNQAHCTVYISGPGSGACTSSGSRTTAAVPTIKGRFLEVWTKESTIQKFC